VSSQVTGFLPEPLPAMPIAEVEVTRQLALLRSFVSSNIRVRSANYYALLKADQRSKIDDEVLAEYLGEVGEVAILTLLDNHIELKHKALEVLDYEISAKRPLVSDAQQQLLVDELTAEALSVIGPGKLSLDEALNDVRHFIDLLGALIEIIVARLQIKGLAASTTALLDLYHIDLPEREGISIILDGSELWDAATAKYTTNVKVITLAPWVGRHAVSRDWPAFVSFLATELKDQCNFDH
jgi:hypothetical protein